MFRGPLLEGDLDLFHILFPNISGGTRDKYFLGIVNDVHESIQLKPERVESEREWPKLPYRRKEEVDGFVI